MTKNILFISIDPVIYRRRVLNQIETAMDLGWNVRIISCGPELAEKPDYHIHYIRQPFKRGPLRFLYFNYQALRIILGGSLDVIHARGLWVLPAVLIASRLRSFKLIYDAHEFFAGHELFQNHLWRRLTWLKLEKKVIPKSDVVITVSEPLAGFYLKLYPAIKDITVIRSLPKLDENLHAAEKEKSEKLRLLFHGYFLPGRGLMQLLEALAAIKEHPYRLDCIGEGPLEKTLRAKVSSLGLSDTVFFHPFVASDKLIQHIHSADLGIALIEADSTNRAHALPNKFFEYIHAVVPVLASNITTLKEYVDRYKVGFTADPYNHEELVTKLTYILEHKQELDQYRAHCIDAAKELCWQNESSKLQQIYLNLFR